MDGPACAQPDPVTGRPVRRPVVAAVVLATLLAAVAWGVVLRPDAPRSFAIDVAAASLAPEGGADAPTAGRLPSTSTTTEPTPAGLPAAAVDGTWVVDPEAGQLAAGFRVVEELARIGVTEAVGRTGLVSGSLTISGSVISDVAVSVDLASLETGDAHRDHHVRDALATREFPTASFALTEPLELDAIPAEDETVSVVATGEMTIRGVTNPVQVAIDARLVDGTLVVVGSLPVRFTDYAVDVPRSAAVISVSDVGTIEFQLFLIRRSPRLQGAL